MDGLLIGAVARATGLQPSALRFYERIGLLERPHRVNGRRMYAPTAIHQVRLIKLARQLGFKMSEIHTLLHGFTPETPPSARWAALAQAKLSELAAHMAALQEMDRLLRRGLGCACRELADCILLDAPEALDQPLCMTPAPKVAQ